MDALKNKVKKMRAAVYRMPQVRKTAGHVDFFQYEDQVLTMSGWLFDFRYRMKNARFVFYSGRDRLAEFAAARIYRYDVASALKNEAAAQSGYELKLVVRSRQDIQIFMEYDTEKGVQRRRLAAVAGDAKIPGGQAAEIYELPGAKKPDDIRKLRQKIMTGPFEIPQNVREAAADIIIPVYNGFQYLPALFESLPKTKMPYRLLIVNDCSPDGRVLPFLEQYCSGHTEAHLINNETNMGFVGSVNRALRMAEHDVVLLNTDVEVPANWLERLMLPIICNEKVASVTPFTNSGTICSFPNFCQNNEIFEDLPLWQIDQAFSGLHPSYPVIPTGVGFCMGMSLKVIREIGYLDEKTFGKGYCEENDWCRRAVKAGYRNVQADNLFVYHKHGGSFLSEEKKRLMEHNYRKLLQKHPDYDKAVADYCGRDPMAATRRLVMLKLLNTKLEAKTIVAFDHNLGGGAPAYLETRKKEALREGCCFIVVRFSGTYLVEYQYKQYQLYFASDDRRDIWPLLGRVDEIWINELVTFPELYGLMEEVLCLKQQHGAKLTMLLHDYFALCPAINLVDDNGRYCGAADTAGCDKCLSKHAENACLEYESAQKWRSKWQQFLENCDEVRAFSGASQELLEKVYPGLDNITLVPHKPHTMLPPDKKSKTTKTLNVGFVGAIDYKKGLQVIKELCAEIRKQKCEVRLCLLGYSSKEVKSPVFHHTGSYRREELPRLVLENDIDLFFIPAIWPETFSYTTSEIMEMNLPLAVFDIGAPAERVRTYEKGAVIPVGSSAEEILKQLKALAERCGIYGQTIKKKKVLFIAKEKDDVLCRHAEHFREQLALMGYASDCLTPEKWKAAQEQSGLEGYKAVVVYLPENRAFLKNLTSQAQRQDIPVYYAVNEAVPDEKLCCSGMIALSETLAEKLRKKFPSVPVAVCPEMCSMQMQILAKDAFENRIDARGKIRIGCFGGGEADKKALNMVQTVLGEMMQSYPQVHLVLDESVRMEQLDSFQERISRISARNEKELLEEMANLEICLITAKDCGRIRGLRQSAALVHVPDAAVMCKKAEDFDSGEKHGFICEETALHESLVRLIEDAGLREKAGSAAFEEVCAYGTTRTADKAAAEMVLGRM